jgi:hypothetical protein
MADKPKPASEYKGEQLRLVRETCLYVATKLGDLMDEVVVVGGHAPSLLIDQSNLPEGTSAHVGRMDLDVGLKLALLDERRYRTLAERLRGANFMPDLTDDGRPTRQRWKMSGTAGVTVDFLIPPSGPEDQGGKLRDIESDFAAVIAPGLMCAFQDRRRVRIDGRTILGEKAAYGESEQIVGFYTMLEDNLEVPFKTEMLGVEVTVERIDLTDDERIIAVCSRGKARQRVPLLDLPLPSPSPAGADWIAALRRWARVER